MDWKLFVGTFFTIFLAELGDKTQMASLLLAARTKEIWTIFAAASLALICVTFLGVVFADALIKFLSPSLIKKGAGIVFILMGVLIFLDKI